MKRFDMLYRYRRQLIELFDSVLKLHADPVTRRQMSLAIQEELIRRITYAEGRTRKLRSVNNEIKARLARRGSDKQASRDLKTRFSANHEKLGSYKQLLAILRDVGDCLAFTYIDRWDIKPMVFREKPGFLTGKRGNRLERAILRSIFHLGFNAILNDLTHSLRYGDLSIPIDGRVHFIEAKTGRGGSRQRAERQAEGAQRVLDYLANDRVENLYTGVPEMTRRAAHSRPAYHVEVIRRMVRSLPAGGWLREDVEPGLHYLVCDSKCSVSPEEPFQDLAGKRLKVYLTNDFKHQQLAYYPFLLSLADAEQVFRFYAGEFIIVVMVDVGYVSEAVGQHGHTLQMTDDSQWPWEIRHRDGDGFIRLSYHLLGRLAAEFLALTWLITEQLANLDWLAGRSGTRVI